MRKRESILHVILLLKCKLLAASFCGALPAAESPYPNPEPAESSFLHVEAKDLSPDTVTVDSSPFRPQPVYGRDPGQLPGTVQLGRLLRPHDGRFTSMQPANSGISIQSFVG
jgi:hypothetical protein